MAINVKKKDLPGSELELEITVPADRINEVKEKMYHKLAPQVVISGFRPGKAPRNLIEARLGARLLEETFNEIIPQATSEAVVQEKISPLDYASYEVKEFTKAGDLTFLAKVIVFPEVKLPNFKKIKVKAEKVKVEAAEVEKLFADLVADVAKSKQQGAQGHDHDHHHDHDHDHDHEGHDHAEHNHDHNHTDHNHSTDEQTSTSTAEINWPEFFNDESLKTDADVREAIRKSLQSRKEAEAEEKYVTEIVEEAVKLANIPLPDKLVQQEAERRQHDYTHRIESLGISVEDFLRTQKTDLETLRKNWEQDARLIIASDLLFLNIAKAEKLEATEAEIDMEIGKISDPKLKQEYSTPAGRNRVSSVILRQKALTKLREAVAPKSESKDAA